MQKIKVAQRVMERVCTPTTLIAGNTRYELKLGTAYRFRAGTCMVRNLALPEILFDNASYMVSSWQYFT